MDRFEPIFKALNATGVRYVVVGGVAVNLHGHQRFTKDVDVVIELVPEHTARALEGLRALGYEPRIPVRLEDFGDPVIRERWIREKGMVVFQMYNDRLRMTVDIFVQYPMDFETLWSAAVEAQLEHARVRVAALDHLIQMKQTVGRPQDVADVAVLTEIQQILAEEIQIPDDEQGSGP
jgi:predicted nucleotidyltransferase